MFNNNDIYLPIETFTHVLYLGLNENINRAIIKLSATWLPNKVHSVLTFPLYFIYHLSKIRKRDNPFCSEKMVLRVLNRSLQILDRILWE